MITITIVIKEDLDETIHTDMTVEAWKPTDDENNEAGTILKALHFLIGIEPPNQTDYWRN